MVDGRRGRMGAPGQRGGGGLWTMLQARAGKPPHTEEGLPKTRGRVHPAGLSPQHTGPPAGECAVGSISSLPQVGALLSRDGSWIRADPSNALLCASLTHPF